VGVQAFPYFCMASSRKMVVAVVSVVIAVVSVGVVVVSVAVMVVVVVGVVVSTPAARAAMKVE
jgi:hypothetical protein